MSVTLPICENCNGSQPSNYEECTYFTNIKNTNYKPNKNSIKNDHTSVLLIRVLHFDCDRISDDEFLIINRKLRTNSVR